MRGNIERQAGSTRRVSGAAVLMAVGLFAAMGLAACSSRAEPSGATTPATTSAAGPTGAATEPIATSADQAEGSVGWRGALLKPRPGWGKGAEEDETLCMLPSASPASVCKALGHTDSVKDWLFLYASERSAVKGAPADPKTLDGSDMNFWMYNGGELPCDQWTRNKRVDSANKSVGGLVAYYGKWEVTCQDSGASFIVQRWLLPKSRLGVVSYALTEAKAADIYQMVTNMDMAGYEPTEAK